MHSFEWQIRNLLAAFYAQPDGSQWARSRARELVLIEPISIVVVWGGRCWDADHLPRADPLFAVRRADGAIECPPWIKR